MKDAKMMKKAAMKLLKKIDTMSDKDICGITLTLMLKGADPYPSMEGMEEEKDEIEARKRTKYGEEEEKEEVEEREED